MKNHFIPRFYLKRWAVDGRVVEFARRRAGSEIVTPLLRAPSGTGYKEGLYAFDGVPANKREILEERFFQVIDSQAADALRVLESGTSRWTTETRRGWARFLMSLLVRHPDDIAALKRTYPLKFIKASRAEQLDYELARTPSDPPTAEEFFQGLDSSFLENMSLHVLPKMMSHGHTLEGLIDMHWFVVSPPNHGCFYTCDRPIVACGLEKSWGHWIIPIGPRRLFIAANNLDIGLRISNYANGQGWKEINRHILKQSSIYGYAPDASPLPLFQKHLSKEPFTSIFLSPVFAETATHSDDIQYDPPKLRLDLNIPNFE